MRARVALLVGFVALVCSLIVLLNFWPRQKDIAGDRSLPANSVKQTEATSNVPAGWSLIGGVLRPSSDVPAKETLVDRTSKLVQEVPIGRTPRLNANDNEKVSSVFEAAKNRIHPERITPLAAPMPFDKEAYRVDPAKYLATVEPGRVWQSAEPGPNVRPLRLAGRSFHRLRQGETVALKVKTEPGFPVSFTSFDLGAFDGGLPSITVAADSDGIAIANFTGTPGTHRLVNILAASPVASGNQQFTLDVIAPSVVGSSK